MEWTEAFTKKTLPKQATMIDEKRILDSDYTISLPYIDLISSTLPPFWSEVENTRL